MVEEPKKDGDREENSSSEENEAPEKPKAPQRVKKEGNLPMIYALSSGKGGVGKSMLAANLGVYLSRIGNRVLLADAVRWGQNLHTFLDLHKPQYGFQAFIDGEVGNFKDLLVNTPMRNLQIMSGISDTRNLRTPMEQPLLYQYLKKTSGIDLVLVDLGSQHSYTLFEHFIQSDNAVLVVVPEPTAVENTYEFLKSLFFRYFKNVEAKLQAQELVEKVMFEKVKLGIRTPNDMLEALGMFDRKLGDAFAAEIGRFQLKLILNMMQHDSETDIGPGMVDVCRKYFGFDIEFLGAVSYDGAVPSSIRVRKPLHLNSPDCSAVKEIEEIAHLLVHNRLHDAWEDVPAENAEP